MADPRVFISFDFDHDSDQRVLFAGQCKHSKTPFSIQDWSSKEELAQSKWEAALKDKINRCNLMIVLVGKNAWWATGVAKEIVNRQKLHEWVYRDAAMGDIFIAYMSHFPISM